MPLNVLDLVLLAMIAGGTWLGYSRGFIVQFVSIASFFLAYIAAFVLYDTVVPWISILLPLPSGEGFAASASVAFAERYLYRVIAFIVIFIAVRIGLVWAGRLLNFMARDSGLGSFNRWSGALLGLVEATLLVVLTVYLLNYIPSPAIQHLYTKSEIASYIMQYSPAFAAKLHSLWGRVPDAMILFEPKTYYPEKTLYIQHHERG